MEQFDSNFVKSFNSLADFKKWGASVPEWKYTDEMLTKAWNEVNPAQSAQPITTKSTATTATQTPA